MVHLVCKVHKVTKATKEIQELPDSKAFQDYKVGKVILGFWAIKASSEHKGFKVIEDYRDLRAFKEFKVIKDFRDLPAVQVIWEQTVPKDHKDRLGIKVFKAHRATRAVKAFKDLWGVREIPGIRDGRGNKDLKI
jgi:hypothetical protein